MEEEKKIDEPSQEDAQIEEVEETEEEKKDKKIKNLISAVILLAGLFAGSLFVDVIQMVRGGGFSQHALSSTDVFTMAGKTWVAYPDPIVKVQVVSDDTCDACNPDEVLVSLKQALPTMQNEKVDVNSAQGKKLVSEFNIKTIPAFIFSNEIEKTDLFSKAQPFLNKQTDGYAIKGAEAGFPIGKYIAAPAISDKDITIGSNEANVKVVVFGNLQNPTDKKAYADIVTPMLKDYGDKIQFAFKPAVQQGATQATSATLATMCANEQGKFTDYVGKVFDGQSVWGKAKDALPILKGYAQQVGLNAGDFNSCLDSKKYQDQITANMQDIQNFGIQTTPSIFVGTDLQAATAKYDDVKKAIDAQLNQ